ncbi:MAG: ComEC/Rec2 family competence protein [Minisyncoccota bacterium]
MQDHLESIRQISRRNVQIFVSLWGFIFGIFVSSYVFIPPLVCILIVVVALVIYFLDKHVLLCIALCTFALGGLRYDIKDFHEIHPAGDRGIVVSEPEYRDLDTRFVVKTNTGEKVLVTTDILSEVLYGDEVRLVGEKRLLKPGDYADYLSKDDIFYTSRSKVEIISRGNGNPIKSGLLSIKSVFVEGTRDILPEPESSLLSGLIVSGKQALPEETLEEFRKSGVVHIVVLSGYNITIIAEFLFLIFGFLGTYRAAWVSVVGVLLFTLMSGAPATVVRGAIMVLLLMFGKIIRRPGSVSRILLFTAVLMLMINPKLLVFDASFQLSFLAVLGLIYGTPILEALAAKILPAHGREGNLPAGKAGSRTISSQLISLIAATLATQIFVLPFLLYNMGNFSLVFLISNLLILPVLPIVMLLGFVSVLISFITNVIAWPLAFITHLLLKWVLWTASFLGNLPFASLEIENFPLWVSVVLYLVLGVTLWLSKDFPQRSASLD